MRSCAKKLQKVLAVSKKKLTFADVILTSMHMRTSSDLKQSQIEVLQFVRPADAACIVTDGKQVRIYRQGEHLARPTLKSAIAYLETRGYNIVNQ